MEAVGVQSDGSSAHIDNNCQPTAISRARHLTESTIAIDPAAILADLKVGEVDVLENVVAGGDIAVWRVQCGDRSYALRVFRPEQTNDFEREVIAMRAAGVAGIPVPSVCAERSWQGYRVLLLSWCPGDTMLRVLRAHPFRIWHVGSRFGQMLARIHQIRVDQSMPLEETDWIAWVGETEQPLQQLLRGLHLRSDALLHLDYHLTNVLSDGQQVTGVIDWANVCMGDPRAAVARAIVFIRCSSRRTGTPFDNMARRLFVRAFLQGYRNESCLCGDLAPFLAWAGLVELAAEVPKIEREMGEISPVVHRSYIEPLHRWIAYWKRKSGLDS